jgi:hypothetical protein
MAIFLAFTAALMMGMVPEIVYHEGLLPSERAVPRVAHEQAVVSACAGFLAALLSLESLNSGSWSKALRLTIPWLILLPAALLPIGLHLAWFWAVCVSLPLGFLAYRKMLQLGSK